MSKKIYLVCSLPNASTLISGIAFEPHPDGSMVSCDPVEGDEAERLLSVPGFEGREWKLEEPKPEPVKPAAAAQPETAAKATKTAEPAPTKGKPGRPKKAEAEKSNSAKTPEKAKENAEAEKAEKSEDENTPPNETDSASEKPAAETKPEGAPEGEEKGASDGD